MSKLKKPKLRLLTSTAISRTIEKEVRVEITKFASKQMERLPQYILEHALKWIELMSEHGIALTRKISSYHDEPLKGERLGQRSIRLNRSWRLIYQEIQFENRTWVQVTVIEVNKHDY